MSDVYIPQIDWWTEETPKTEVVQEEAFLWEICESQDFQEHFQAEFDKILQNKEQFSESQKETLVNIYCNLWEENPELKKAIETQTIKMFEVPGRDLVALSIDWRNVDYFFDLEWNIFVNIDKFRKSIFSENMPEILFKISWAKELNEDWIYNLYINWEKIPVFWKEYLKILLSYFDMNFDFIKSLQSYYKISDEEIKKELNN